MKKKYQILLLTLFGMSGSVLYAVQDDELVEIRSQQANNLLDGGDDIIMSAPPLKSKKQAEALYHAVADAFSKILDRNVRFVQPESRFVYRRKMRKGDYDIVFDEPHFASWRIKHLEHELLVKLTGEIKFVTLIHKKNKDISSLNDLIGKKICSISPPNLSALTVLDYYKNPAQQPILQGVRGDVNKVVSRFYNGSCDAAVVRNSFYKKHLTLLEQENTTVLFHSKSLPNQAFTVSNKLSSAEVARLASEIEFGQANVAMAAVAKYYAGENAKFLAAETSEYQDQRLLLEGVILGW